MPYAITARGAKLAACLGATDPEAVGIVSAIARHAATLARLAEEECNGPAWMDASDRALGMAYRTGDPDHAIKVIGHAERVQRWERRIEEESERAERRIWALTHELNRYGVPVVAEMGGDPRGYVVRLVWPSPLRSPVHACATRGAAHCRGGAGGACDAVGMD